MTIDIPTVVGDGVVTANSLIDVADAGFDVAVARARNSGEYVSVPEYAGQPGTVVFGGARPPPQSRNLQISPVPGT